MCILYIEASRSLLFGPQGNQQLEEAWIKYSNLNEIKLLTLILELDNIWSKRRRHSRLTMILQTNHLFPNGASVQIELYKLKRQFYDLQLLRITRIPDASRILAYELYIFSYVKTLPSSSLSAYRTQELKSEKYQQQEQIIIY